MSNASTHLPGNTTPSTTGATVTTYFKGGQYQIHHINYTYCYTQHEAHIEYHETLVDSSANSGMARSDTHVFSTVPHAFVDITGVGGEILRCLPIVQCASVVETVDEGLVLLIMSQYALKIDSLKVSG